MAAPNGARIRNLPSSRGRPEQIAEKQSQDERQEDYAHEIDRVKNYENEKAGQRKRPDIEWSAQKIRQPKPWSWILRFLIDPRNHFRNCLFSAHEQSIGLLRDLFAAPQIELAGGKHWNGVNAPNEFRDPKVRHASFA